MSGRPAERYSQAARLVSQALHLWKGGHLQPDDEARRLGVTRRTVERDLRELQTAFESVELRLEPGEGADGRVEYRMAGGRSANPHRRWQALAVVLGVELSHFLGGQRFARDTHALREELLAGLGTVHRVQMKEALANRIHVVKTGRKDYRHRDHVTHALSNLLDALLERRVLRLTYTSPASGRTRPLVVHPLSLVLNRSALYAIVELVEPVERLPGRILLAIDRMRYTSIDWAEAVREYPRDFDADQFLASAFEIVAGPVEHVVLEVSAAHVPYLHEHYWHASARFEPLTPEGGKAQADQAETGAELLDLDVYPGVDLENWILSMADRVTVRAPAALRERIQQRLTAALAAYTT